MSADTIARGLALKLASRAVARVAPQVVCTRGQFPVNLEANTASNFTRYEATLNCFVGPQPVDSLQVAFCNIYAAVAGEVTPVDDLAVESALWISGASAVHPAFFRGAKSPTLSAGAGLVLSDSIGMELEAGAVLQMRTAMIVASGGQPACGGRFARSGDNAFKSTATASQVYATSTMTTPSGGSSSLTYYACPVAIIGVPKQSHPAVLIWGDSIGDGTGDTNDGNGNKGYIARGLYAVLSTQTYPMAYVNGSRTGDNTSSYGANNSAARRAMMRYVSHVIYELGSNDPGSSRSLAQMQASALVAWQSAHRLGCNAWHCKILPRTTSTDSWATAANQTYVTGFEVGGQVDQFNAWLDTQVTAGNLDGVIDANPYVVDQANPRKWASNGTANYGTTDGIHPSAALHALAGQAVTAAALTFRAVGA